MDVPLFRPSTVKSRGVTDVVRVGIVFRINVCVVVERRLNKPVGTPHIRLGLSSIPAEYIGIVQRIVNQANWQISSTGDWMPLDRQLESPVARRANWPHTMGFQPFSRHRHFRKADQTYIYIKVMGARWTSCSSSLLALGLLSLAY